MHHERVTQGMITAVLDVRHGPRHQAALTAEQYRAACDSVRAELEELFRYLELEQSCHHEPGQSHILYRNTRGAT